MIYELCQARDDALARLLPFVHGAGGVLRAWDVGGIAALPLRQATDTLELMADAGARYRRPAFGLDQLCMEGHHVQVREEALLALPFGTLLHFAKDVADPGPRVLLVAPLSGHFSTRLRGTVAALLPEHDVYITDWTDARDVPASAGPFGLDELVACIMAFLEAMGSEAHLVAVSQPATAALAATALMAEDGHPGRPRSLTLIAGPVDTRVNPTRDNLLVASLPVAWFEHAMTGVVPHRFQGAGRPVHPGALMLACSAARNLGRHGGDCLTYLHGLMLGDAEAVARVRSSHAEERSVMDVAAELYLDMIRRVFHEHELPRGRMTWRGRAVRPEAIEDVLLLTIEGDRDGICPAGQTRAAHDLCPGLHPALKRHHLQAGADHHALFEGPIWAAEVYPEVKAAIGRSR